MLLLFARLLLLFMSAYRKKYSPREFPVPPAHFFSFAGFFSKGAFTFFLKEHYRPHALHYYPTFSDKLSLFNSSKGIRLHFNSASVQIHLLSFSDFFWPFFGRETLRLFKSLHRQSYHFVSRVSSCLFAGARRSVALDSAVCNLFSLFNQLYRF